MPRTGGASSSGFWARSNSRVARSPETRVTRAPERGGIGFSLPRRSRHRRTRWPRGERARRRGLSSWRGSFRAWSWRSSRCRRRAGRTKPTLMYTGCECLKKGRFYSTFDTVKTMSKDIPEEAVISGTQPMAQSKQSQSGARSSQPLSA